MFLRMSSGRPSAESSAVAASVKAVKLTIEPGHDGERPSAAAGSTAREDDRQNRQDARADRRDHAGDERDPDEQSHLGDRSRRF